MSPKKVIYTLNIGNYAPEITSITYPFLQAYAERIGAEFHVISERKFPGWPIPCEKLQIYQLGKHNDWNIYIDSDTLVHPETIDFTMFIGKETVVHNGSDFAQIRVMPRKYDRFFLRNRRNIGSCNWFTIGSDWCIDLWEPLQDLSMEEAISNITPTVLERNSGVIDSAHLLDDYILSRNIAKYGLHFKRVPDILSDLGILGCNFLWHMYDVPIADYTDKEGKPAKGKLTQMREILANWRL